MFTPQNLEVRITDNEVVKVHREVVTGKSRVLRDMLEACPETDTLDVRALISDPLHVFETVILPLTYGKGISDYRLTKEEQLSSLAIAVKLDMPDVLRDLSVDQFDIPGLWELLKNLSDYRLQAWQEVPMFKEAIVRLASLMNAIWLTDMSELPVDMLQAILMHETLDVTLESQLLYVVDSYVKKAKPSALDIEKLYATIALTNLNNAYLASFAADKSKPSLFRRAAEREICERAVRDCWYSETSTGVKRLTGELPQSYRNKKRKLSDGTVMPVSDRNKLVIHRPIYPVVLSPTDVDGLKSMCTASKNLCYGGIYTTTYDSPDIISSLTSGDNSATFTLQAHERFLYVGNIRLQMDFIIDTVTLKSLSLHLGGINVNLKWCVSRNKRRNESVVTAHLLHEALLFVPAVYDTIKIELQTSSAVPLANVSLTVLNAIVFRAEQQPDVSITSDCEST